VQADCISGFSTGINMLVKAIAFAELAGLRAQYGIYSATLPVLVYAIFGGSKDLGVGPSPLVCLLLMQF
jgi:MFS superfamily sulfate permease-like transporter